MTRAPETTSPPDGNPGIKRSQKQPGQDLRHDEDQAERDREQPGPGAKAPGMAPRQPG